MARAWTACFNWFDRATVRPGFGLGLGLSLALTTACFDGEGLRGAPCLADADCGPTLTCEGPEGAGVCGGADSDSPTGSRWPDSPKVYCTDGSTDLDACPEPGNLGYGQDGNYRISVPSYSESDDIVHDSITQLDWEARSTNSGFTRLLAIDRCANLQLGGRSWRLPSRLELASLLNYGREVPFSGVDDGPHWSASDGPDAGEGWAVDFLIQAPQLVSSLDESFVICVSGEPLLNSFTQSPDTIVDSMSGLEWQRERSQPMPWFEALNLCEGLTLAGNSDWRLPSAKELVSLGQDDQTWVVGLEGDDDQLWTSSPDWPPERAVVFRLPVGLVGADTVDLSHRVRCVRGG